MKKIVLTGLFALITIGIAFQGATLTAGGQLQEPVPAPEFTHHGQEDWINSAPLTIDDLKGRVVLIDFWTFDCWNCYRSFPWLKAMEKRLARENFQVIGVHSPEFAHEKVRANIVAKVKEFGLDHPVMIDNDFSYWRAMDNRYWPAFYILDQNGLIRATFVGETHEGDDRARRIEATVRDLLAQAPE